MYKRNLRLVEPVLLILLAMALAWGTALEKQQQQISDKLIRMHVVAESDSPEDQRIKLAVRDAVLSEAEVLLEHAEDVATAKTLLRENLPQLMSAAKDVLQRESCPQAVSVTLDRELFGTREYEHFALPGGYYDALKVVIGQGAGKNWWCVVYPQICTAATLDRQEAVAVMGGMEQEELAILEGETPKYQLKFRSIELLEDLLGWFRGGADGIPVSR